MQLIFLGFLITKIFALAAGIYYFKHLPTPYRLVFTQIAIAVFTESYGYYIKSTNHINVWLFNLYLLVEVWLLGSAGMYFLPSRKAKTITIAFLVICTIIWGVTIAVNSLYVFANYTYTCSALLLTVLYISVLFANSLFSTKQILKQPLFWLALPHILYYGCIVPFFGLFNYLTQIRTLGQELAIINHTLNLIRYPMIGVSFILLGKEMLSNKARSSQQSPSLTRGLK